MNIKLQDLTFDTVQQVFADDFTRPYNKGVNFPNASDSSTFIRDEKDLERWKEEKSRVYGNIELGLNPDAKEWYNKVKVLDQKFMDDKNRYIGAKASYLDSERAAGRTSGLDEGEMSSGDYIKFLMDKFYEYRMLAADPTLTTQASKLYLDKASEYYARAQEEMDKITPDMTDHLSDEDKALPNVPLSARDQAMVDDYEEEEANREVPRDYASMYENKNKNKMNDINLNRWAKLAGINENEGIVKGNEEWEGSINQLKKDADNPAGFAEMADIILSKYPDEGPSTYRMEVYHNNDGVVTGASGGFAIDNGNVYFNFKFKDGKVVDYSFDEQNY